MKTTRIAALVAFLVSSGAMPHAAFADQPDGVLRAELQRQDLVVPGREVVQVRVELEPGVEFACHKHPGDEIIYVLEGTFEYRVEGRPPITLSAGQVLFVPSGVTHSARNVGDDNAAELATYIVEIGKPLVLLAQ